MSQPRAQYPHEEQEHVDFRTVRRERQSLVSQFEPFAEFENRNKNDGDDHHPQVILGRSLTQTEILTLQKANCQCRDWSQIRIVGGGDCDGILGNYYDVLEDGLVGSDTTPSISTGNNHHHPIRFITDTYFVDRVIFVFQNRTLLSSSSSSSSSSDNPDRDDNCFFVIPGIHKCCIRNSIVLIHDTNWTSICFWNSTIENAWIDGYETTIWNSSILRHNTSRVRVSISHHHHPYQKRSITVGPESGGGRHLSLSHEATMIQVGQQLKNQNTGSNKQDEEDHQFWEEYPYRKDITIIGSHCIIRDTPTVRAVCMHPHSTILAASSVSDSLLFPHSQISNHSVVDNVTLQWNATIQSNSHVTQSMLMEYASVGPHSLIHSTVLGPDAHASAGEIHHSILGPNTNAHHQSLLISTLWMLGRGNVGYGANVGSNHTGRMPDQEICVGEGIFWGLSTVIKFPLDLSASPYTIIAAGITMPPQQRIAMPFSLITHNHENQNNNTITTSFNPLAIVPGWVWLHSPYTVVRSEIKFRARRKAVRHGYYTAWNIWRPDIIQIMIRARQFLQTTTSQHPSTTLPSQSQKKLTSNPFLGVCGLTENAQKQGIVAYTECIQLFALRGLYNFLIQQDHPMEETDRRIERLHAELSQLNRCGTSNNNNNSNFSSPISSSAAVGALEGGTVQNWDSKPSWLPFPWESEYRSPESVWTYQKSLLMSEFPFAPNIENSRHWNEWLQRRLDQLLELEQVHLDRVCHCRERDDIRGEKTIPDYAAAHIAAQCDPVIQWLQKDLEEKRKRLQKLMNNP